MVILLISGIITLVIGIVMNNDVLLIISIIMILLRNVKKVSDTK